MIPVLLATSVWRHFFAGRTGARPLGALLEEEGIVWSLDAAAVAVAWELGTAFEPGAISPQ